MNSNYINNIQEIEIDKILQDGIDKSLLYIQSLNTTNNSNIPNFTKKNSTVPVNKQKIKNRTTKNSNRNTFNKKRTLSKTNIKKNTFPLTLIEPNNNNYNNNNTYNNTKLNKRAKSNNKVKKIRKINIFDYQLEYNKKKEELEMYKKQLIQERIKQNKLKKEINSKSKKEEEFKKLEENNNTIKNNSDELILKIQRSEKLREEQAKLIDGLLKEYNNMINALRNNPDVEIINKYRELESEAENLKNEGNIQKDKKKKKKTFKKI